jgi:hypothetical protein
MVKSAVEVDSPRPDVFGILTDFAKYTKWVPGCESCSVLSSQGHISTVEIVLNSMKRITLSLRFDAEPDQLLKFELISSKDVKGYSGTYKLMNGTSGGTVLVTEMELDAGALAPKFMVERMVKSTLAATGDALRKHAKTVQPIASAAAPASKDVRPEKKVRRSKYLLRVMKTDSGERIWYAGRMFNPE